MGPKRRAIDWAKLRWADFAEANAVELAPPRKDAVAPITTIAPASLGIGLPGRLHTLYRGLFDIIPFTRPCVVNQHIYFA